MIIRTTSLLATASGLRRIINACLDYTLGTASTTSILGAIPVAETIFIKEKTLEDMPVPQGSPIPTPLASHD